MGHKHSVYDSDAHFSINPITKVIKNESSKKTTLVQGDHNSERFTFEMPRFGADGHDMMLCDLIEIHYDNYETGTENVSSDYYEAKDKQISPDDENIVIFSWLIRDTATKYAGTLEFSVLFKCMENGDCTYQWGTDINTDFSVKKGKNNSGVVVERAPNVVDQWRNEIFGDAENAVANINLAEKNALEAVQAEGAEQVAAVTAEGTKQVENVRVAAEAIEASREQIHLNNALKAAVIAGSAEGEVILLADSTEQPFGMFKLFGKSEQAKTQGNQLFNACGTQNNAFGTAEVSEKGKVISVTGTYYVSFPIALTAGETYYVDFKYKTDGGNYGIRFEYVDNSISETLTNPFVFVPEKDVVSIYLYSSTGEEKTVVYEDVQVCKGNTALPWEEYSGGIPSPNPEYPQGINGVENPTITVKDNEENEQNLSLPYTLHGIPVTSGGNYTDADGQQWICDEVDLAKRKYIQRCEETILDGETSVLSLRGEMDNTVYVITKDNNRYIPKTNLLCDKLPMKNTIYSTAVEGIRVEGTESSFGIRFRIATERLSSVDVAGVKEFLTNNPMRVVAPLVELIETALTDEEIEAFKALHSNFPNTTIMNDAGTHMAVKYGIDTKTYIDKKFEELKSLIS